MILCAYIYILATKLDLQLKHYSPLPTAPTMPRNLTGEGVSAAGLSLSWLLPTDNGGHPVTRYIIRYRAVGTVPFSEIALTETSLLLFNGGTPSPPVNLVSSTSYE